MSENKEKHDGPYPIPDEWESVYHPESRLSNGERVDDVISEHDDEIISLRHRVKDLKTQVQVTRFVVLFLLASNIFQVMRGAGWL